MGLFPAKMNGLTIPKSKKSKRVSLGVQIKIENVTKFFTTFSVLITIATIVLIYEIVSAKIVKYFDSMENDANVKQNKRNGL